MNETENILGMQDLLERSLQEIKKRFLPFFILAVCAPLAGWFVQGIFLGFDPLHQNTQPGVWVSLVSSVLIGLLSAWFGIALILFICKHTQTLLESLILALHRFPRFIGGILLYFLAIVLGFIIMGAITWAILYILNGFPIVAWLLIALWVLFFIVVFFVIAVYWIFVPYLFVLTEWPLMNCFTQSYQLVKGHFWHTVGFLFLLSIIGIGISVIGVLAIGLLGGIAWILLPTSRYIIFGLWSIPAALVTLTYQVPLVALYLDLSPSLEIEK